MKKGGHQPDFVDREFNESLFRGRGGDPDGDFSLSGYGQFGGLAGMVGKALFVFRIQENEFKRFQVPVLGLGDDLIDADRIGFIGIYHEDTPSISPQRRS
jgi:hypothetical protein